MLERKGKKAGTKTDFGIAGRSILLIDWEFERPTSQRRTLNVESHPAARDEDHQMA
jgi:hypothetical protein